METYTNNKYSVVDVSGYVALTLAFLAIFINVVMLIEQQRSFHINNAIIAILVFYGYLVTRQ